MIVVAGGGREIELVGEVAASLAVVVDFCTAERFVFAMAVGAAHVEGDVAPGLHQPSVQLHVSVHIVAVPAAHVLPHIIVDGDAVAHHLVFFQVVLCERVVHEGVWVSVERHTGRQTAVFALGV